MQPITEEMLEELVASKGSGALKEQWPRNGIFHDRCYLVAGPLEVAGDWEPFRAMEPGALIVVDGPVKVGRFFDMLPDTNADCTGFLLVLGNVTCKHFVNYYGGLVFVDGDFDVSGVAVNAFEDAGLIVTKDVRIHHFHGLDIWVDFGGQAFIEYGDGYGLPLGREKHRPHQAVYPRHRDHPSLADLGVKTDEDGYVNVNELVRQLKSRP